MCRVIRLLDEELHWAHQNINVHADSANFSDVQQSVFGARCPSAGPVTRTDTSAVIQYTAPKYANTAVGESRLLQGAHEPLLGLAVDSRDVLEESGRNDSISEWGPNQAYAPTGVDAYDGRNNEGTSIKDQEANQPSVVLTACDEGEHGKEDVEEGRLDQVLGAGVLDVRGECGSETEEERKANHACVDLLAAYEENATDQEDMEDGEANQASVIAPAWYDVGICLVLLTMLGNCGRRGKYVV